MANAKTIDYQKYLIESLREPEEAANYLNAALEGAISQYSFWHYRTLYKLEVEWRKSQEKLTEVVLVYTKLFPPKVILI